MSKTMVFKTIYEGSKKWYVCPFCRSTFRKLDNAIDCYQACEAKAAETEGQAHIYSSDSAGLKN